MHLTTLKNHDIVVQDDQEYVLGPQLLAHGEYVRNHSDLYQASCNQVAKLARESGECGHLLTDYDGQLYALYERFGESAVGVKRHDQKREKPVDHLHCTAAGKAILAHKPPDVSREILDARDLRATAPNTVTDTDALFDEFEQIRERGYPVADEEQIPGIRPVGAPIDGPDGEVAGAIAVSGPTQRLEGDTFRDELPSMVTQAANICEVNFQADSIDDTAL